MKSFLPLLAAVLASTFTTALGDSLENLRNYRYCEVLTMSSHSHLKISLDVYNTIDLNLWRTWFGGGEKIGRFAKASNEPA